MILPKATATASAAVAASTVAAAIDIAFHIDVVVVVFSDVIFVAAHGSIVRKKLYVKLEFTMKSFNINHIVTANIRKYKLQ